MILLYGIKISLFSCLLELPAGQARAMRLHAMALARSSQGESSGVGLVANPAHIFFNSKLVVLAESLGQGHHCFAHVAEFL